MSHKDTTDTYLNLNSEQFNSWIKEYDNKYKKVIESNQQYLTDNKSDEMESFDNIASEDSIEIEESSDSESNTVESSNVFIKKEPIKKITTENTSSSTRVKSLYRRGRTIIKRTSDISSEKKNSKKNSKKESRNISSNNKKKLTLTDSSSDRDKLVFSERKVVENQEDIISLSQLNSMIPKFNKKIQKEEKVINVKNKENRVNEKPKVKHSRLGEQALYKFITNRRR